MTLQLAFFINPIQTRLFCAPTTKGGHIVTPPPLPNKPLLTFSESIQVKFEMRGVGLGTTVEYMRRVSRQI